MLVRVILMAWAAMLMAGCYVDFRDGLQCESDADCRGYTCIHSVMGSVCREECDYPGESAACAPGSECTTVRDGDTFRDVCLPTSHDSTL